MAFGLEESSLPRVEVVLLLIALRLVVITMREVLRACKTLALHLAGNGKIARALLLLLLG
jgi:hypothetical protein